MPVAAVADTVATSPALAITIANTLVEPEKVCRAVKVLAALLVVNAPAEPTATPKAVTTPVPVVVVAGAAPAPPPITKAFAAKAADVAQVVPLLKYGTPPEVPAIVNAGVVVPVATDTIPPVQPTDVTVPEPLLLNVVQSAAVRAPRLVADADGRLSVMTGVVVPVATVDETSVPVVPKVSAATEVTVPPVPVALMVMAPDPLVMVTPVPAVNVAFVSVLPVVLPISNCPSV